MGKVVFLDVDGTLLNSRHQMSARTCRAIEELGRRGIAVVLASARMPGAMQAYHRRLHLETPMICYNGALIIVGQSGKRRVAQEHRISCSDARQILERLRAWPCSISLYRDNLWYTEDAKDPWILAERAATGLRPRFEKLDALLQQWTRTGLGPHKLLCVGPAVMLDAVTLALSAPTHSLKWVRSKSTYLEIMEKSASKALAAAYVLGVLGSDPAHAIAVGDSENDLELIEMVGEGVAMGNAPPWVQARARQVTQSNDAEGLAIFLEQRFGLNPAHAEPL